MIGLTASPMKKKIHFLSNTYGQLVTHVWLLDIKSKKLTDLTSDSPYRHLFANWSPDGKWISYATFVDPWWTMFKNTEWEVYIMDFNNKSDLSHKIGKGSQSQWIDTSRLAVFDERLFKVYDLQAKRVVRELKVDDPCSSDFAIGKTIDTLFYKSMCGHEGERKKIKILDLKSRVQRELIFDAENPTYIR